MIRTIRSLIAVIVAAGITAVAIFVFTNRDNTGRVVFQSIDPSFLWDSSGSPMSVFQDSSIPEENLEISRDLPPSQKKTPDTAALYIENKDAIEKGAENPENSSIQSADALIKEALAHADYEEYKTLIRIVEKYETDVLPLLTEANQTILDTIDRHIFILAPFYYYVHSEAQPPIRKLLQALRQRHDELLSILADKNPILAGEISTGYIKLLADDIAKSGRRRNSDFVFLSFADYKNYRAIFDRLSLAEPKFREGFARNGAVLFSSFYNMHRDVGPDHNQEVRGYLKQMRVELVELHQKALKELAIEDKKSAREKTEEIINLLKNELKAHANDNPEVPQYINEDLNSYEELRKEF